MDNCTDPINSCTDAMGIYYGYVFILTSVVCIGIILNIFSLTIFLKQASQFQSLGPFVLFLRHLALSDLLYLVFMSCIGVCRCDAISSEVGQNYCNIYLAYIFRPIGNALITVSVWITVSMSIERFIVIKKTKTLQYELTNASVRLFVLCIYAASFVLHLPFFFYMDIENGETEKSEISHTYGYGIWAWFRAALAKYFPIIIITVCNVAIIGELWSLRNRRFKIIKAQNKSASKPKMSSKTTPLLLGISFTFIICNILEPFIYLDVYEPCGVYSYGYQVLAVVVNILETLSATVNFVFYVAFNRKFRNAFYSLMPCLKNMVRPINTEVANISMTVTTKRDK